MIPSTGSVRGSIRMIPLGLRFRGDFASNFCLSAGSEIWTLAPKFQDLEYRVQGRDGV